MGESRRLTLGRRRCPLSADIAPRSHPLPRSNHKRSTVPLSLSCGLLLSSAVLSPQASAENDRQHTNQVGYSSTNGTFRDAIDEIRGLDALETINVYQCQDEDSATAHQSAHRNRPV